MSEHFLLFDSEFLLLGANVAVASVLVGLIGDQKKRHQRSELSARRRGEAQ